ncbi:UDP-N-acetylglucosamine 2-epimerase [Dactylosporangium sp. NPDC005572]|uniref:UDP-N-acetylglucosamine 2-epimerase n=1 Tax=Dactylosporangium sp. NPDC005572 TaxID=3156889 RepID=UPI00339E96DD
MTRRPFPAHLVLICGVRPQYIKAAALQYELQRCSAAPFTTTIIDTAQHFSPPMNDLLMREIGLEPTIRLRHPSRSSPAEVLGSTVSQLGNLSSQWPLTTTVVVFGDANPMLAGALTAKLNGFRLVHVEAGERRIGGEQESFNSRAADLAADLAFCVSASAAEALRAEGFTGQLVRTGDLAARWFTHMIAPPPAGDRTGDRTGADANRVMVTLHRPENMNIGTMRQLLTRLLDRGKTVHWILHPRSAAMVRRASKELPVVLHEPMGFRQVLRALSDAAFLVSDSGGLIREAHLLGRPALAVNTAVWTDLHDAGLIRHVGPDLSDLDAGIAWVEQLRGALPPSPLMVPGGIDEGIDALLTLANRP